jgi:hypothetical protein
MEGIMLPISHHSSTYLAITMKYQVMSGERPKHEMFHIRRSTDHYIARFGDIIKVTLGNTGMT